MRFMFTTIVILGLALSGCDNGGGNSPKSQSSTNSSANSSAPNSVTPKPFTPKAFAGFIPPFEGEVALAIVTGHAITATRQPDINGDEKIYFYFQNTEGEDVPGASRYGIESSIYPALYLQEDNVVCLQYDGYQEFTTSVVGDIQSDAMTFRQCDREVIQASDISADWQPTYMEFLNLQQMLDNMILDSTGIESFVIKATTDPEGDVRLYTSNPYSANYEALVDVDRGIICANFMNTGPLGAFFTRVEGSDELSTDDLHLYLGDDLIKDKVIFYPDCNYDLVDWMSE